MVERQREKKRECECVCILAKGRLNELYFITYIVYVLTVIDRKDREALNK